jgi:hypothetical protein
MQTFFLVLVPWLVISLLAGNLTGDARAEAWHVRAAQFGDHVFREKRWLFVFCLASLVVGFAP